jgi:hypothetical protein
MDIKCRLCLFKTELDQSVNIFTPGKNNELISDTIMSFVPIKVRLSQFFLLNFIHTDVLAVS